MPRAAPRDHFHGWLAYGPVTVEVARHSDLYGFEWGVTVWRGGQVVQQHRRLRRQHAETILREWRENGRELLRKPT